MVHWIQILLMMPILGSPVGEWLLLLLNVASNLLNGLFLTSQDVRAYCALLPVKSTDCTNQWPHQFVSALFPFNLLITLNFACSDGIGHPNSDLGTHLTLQTASRSYVTSLHSKCAVFVLLFFSCTNHGISFCSAPLLALVAII